MDWKETVIRYEEAKAIDEEVERQYKRSKGIGG